MTVGTTLHLLSTDQYPSLIEQLVQPTHQPACSQFLGWFLNTGYSDIDTLGRSKVYSTHPNPSYLPVNEPVVIVVNNFHRLRIYVSTEPTLNSQPCSDTMKKQASVGEWHSQKAPNLYDGHVRDREYLQDLYKRSVDVLDSVMLQVDKWIDHDGILLHGVSLLWEPLIHALYNIDSYGPCTTFVKPINKNDQPFTSPYPLSKLEAKDLQTVVEKNKIAYDSDYVKDCLRVSSALRHNDQLIAWGYTHRDLPIGGLHVLPEYRRQQLASIIVADLSNQQSRFFRDHAPHSDRITYYIQSMVEFSNPASNQLFERLGFDKVGLGMTWTWIVPKTPRKE